jgi:hypothetical protein
MTTAPAQGKPKEKKADGKQYHWCPNHKQWMCHKLSECSLTGNDKKSFCKSNKKQRCGKGKIGLKTSKNCVWYGPWIMLQHWLHQLTVYFMVSTMLTSVGKSKQAESGTNTLSGSWNLPG